MEKEHTKDTTTVAIYKETHIGLIGLAGTATIAAGKKISIKQVLKELVEKAQKDENK